MALRRRRGTSVLTTVFFPGFTPDKGLWVCKVSWSKYNQGSQRSQEHCFYLQASRPVPGDLPGPLLEAWVSLCLVSVLS